VLYVPVFIVCRPSLLFSYYQDSLLVNLKSGINALFLLIWLDLTVISRPALVCDTSVGELAL